MTDALETRVGTMLNGTASGLIPMAIFTPVYAIWPVFAWPAPGLVFFILAAAWAITLAVSAVRLIRLGRELPHETNDDDARIGKAMAVLGGLQGGLIAVSVVVLAVLELWVWILPAIALIVALHFYPMTAIFRRTIDYYLGTAMLLVAAAGLLLASQPGVPWQNTWGIVGIGGALVTGAYGFWMLWTARRLRAGYARITATSARPA